MLFAFLLALNIALAVSVDTTTGDWIPAVKSKGWSIREGKWDYYPLKSCEAPGADTCFALNALTPYGLIYLPRAEGEEEGQIPWCPHNLCVKDDKGKDYAAKWRVNKGEVILLTGRTPPDSRYWSFTPYIYSEFHKKGWKTNFPPEDSWKSAFACKEPTDDKGNRCDLFASIDDPINLKNVNVTGSGTTGSKPFALMVSFDSASEKAVVDILAQEKTKGNFPFTLNHFRLPSDIFTLGTTEGDEHEFMVFNRVNNINSKSDYKKFYGKDFKNNKWGMRVFRIQAPKTFAASISDNQRNPTREGKQKLRELGNLESGVGVSHEELNDALNELQSRVVKHLQAQHLDVISKGMVAFVKVTGYECVNQGWQCNGDCGDTVYPRGDFNERGKQCKAEGNCKPIDDGCLSDTHGDAYYVTGVIHSTTNRSTYSSITMYNVPKLGPVGTFSDSQLKGSADHWLPGNKAAPYLYVAKFARKCNKDNKYFTRCAEVKKKPDNPKVNIPMNYPGEPNSNTAFFERMYLNPYTYVGPSSSEVIMPILSRSYPKAGLRGNEQLEELVTLA